MIKRVEMTLALIALFICHQRSGTVFVTIIEQNSTNLGANESVAFH